MRIISACDNELLLLVPYNNIFGHDGSKYNALNVSLPCFQSGNTSAAADLGQGQVSSLTQQIDVFRDELKKKVIIREWSNILS